MTQLKSQAQSTTEALMVRLQSQVRLLGISMYNVFLVANFVL